MNRKDLLSIEYIVTGLLRDMPRRPGFGEGYYAGVRQMQNAVRLLVSGDGVSLDGIVRESRKLGIKRPKSIKSLQRAAARHGLLPDITTSEPGRVGPTAIHD